MPRGFPAVPKYRCPDHRGAPETPAAVQVAITNYAMRKATNAVTEASIRCADHARRYLNRRPTMQHVLPKLDVRT